MYLELQTVMLSVTINAFFEVIVFRLFSNSEYCYALEEKKSHIKDSNYDQS